MKNPQEIAMSIKETAKSKDITIKKMLTDCDLSINTLSSMQSGGFFPRLEAINKIADYLGVSIDFLLGRTDTPTGYSSGVSNVQMNVNSPQGNNTINNRTETISAEDVELLELIKKLPLKKRVKFISSLYDELGE
ncbi:MAG: hypothetical protein K2J40_07450 [Ruminococcus sp.]|nr:hypothetical protein [Ruminococcus sp.]